MPSIEPATTTAPIDWNDAYYEAHYAGYGYISRRPDISTCVAYAKMFLNFYLYGEKVSNMDSILAALLSITRAESSEYLIPNHLVDATKGIQIPSTGAVVKRRGNWSSFATASSISITVPLTSADVDAWYDTITSYLELPASPDGVNSDTQLALNLVAFTALSMLRLLTEDSFSAAVNIMNVTFDRFNNLWPNTLKLKFIPPPRDSSAIVFQRMFKRFKPRTTKVMALLVNAYTKAPHCSKNRIREILKAGGLIELSKVGIGCVKWLQEASDKLGPDLRNILETVSYLFMKDAMKSIKDFSKSISREPYGSTWPWARIFTDRAFQSISTRRNMIFSAMLMAITIDCDIYHTMWESPQFKAKITKKQKALACYWAKSIMSGFKKRMDFDAWSSMDELFSDTDEEN